MNSASLSHCQEAGCRPRSLAEHRARRAANRRNATLYVLAACAGLRAGELRALRWGDVSFARVTVTVEPSRSRPDRPSSCRRSAGGRLRLQRTRRKPLSRTGMRKRFLRTRAAAGLRPLRFHDLRHTFGSIAVREIDTATLKAWMGHARLVTTEQYLHSKPRHVQKTRAETTTPCRTRHPRPGGWYPSWYPRVVPFLSAPSRAQTLASRPAEKGDQLQAAKNPLNLQGF
ncbi:MAG: tyrosine-type recombinase/integrase [Conexibacter sp.]